MATFMVDITKERVDECIGSDNITIILAYATFDKSSMVSKRNIESTLQGSQGLEVICIEVDGDEDATEAALSLSMGVVPMVKIYGPKGYASITLTKAEVQVENIVQCIEDIKHSRVPQNCCAPGTNCVPSSNCCDAESSSPSCCAAAPESSEDILKLVQSSYAKGGCCVSVDSTQCGYTPEELAIAAGANLGLGCGNPLSFSGLQEGEVVVDLGSGAGIDCFLAAQQVGHTGQVIGIDMTPDMVHRARENARQMGCSHVSFRLGEIEHLPVPDGGADCVISNCVINLSPDKAQVFREMYRILKPGGRVAITDVITRQEVPLPQALRTAQALAC